MGFTHIHSSVLAEQQPGLNKTRPGEGSCQGEKKAIKRCVSFSIHNYQGRKCGSIT
jgi:hypothetical protein